MADPVILAPYSAEWPERFARERARLASIFPEAIIEHCGSTAVPGLGAKPIVDILLGASSLAEIESRIPAIQALGYEYIPRWENVLPERRFFAWPAEQPRDFHLHAVTEDSGFFRDHMQFRNALRADPALAAEYWVLKQRLAREHANDREAYTNAKDPFIRAVLARP